MATSGSKGTIKPYGNFNAADDVQKLRKAMKGTGTDEDAIIDVFANRSLSQRQEIKTAYKTAVGKVTTGIKGAARGISCQALLQAMKFPTRAIHSGDHRTPLHVIMGAVRRKDTKELEEDLKSELTGNFERVIVGLITSAVLYDVHELKKAMKGAGTDEGCLIEILASRSPEEIKNINITYRLKYDKPLEDDICSDTSSMLQRVLVSLGAGGRDQGSSVNDSLAKQDAKELYEAGEKKWGTDEVKFLTILCTRNRNHLLKVFDEYKKISNKDIEASIKSEMSGHFEDALLAIVKCIRSRPAYFAERLYKSMKGLGTDDDTLIRIMVSRCEIDMLNIRSEFKKAYGKSLYSFIKGDTSGDYRKILLKLCGGED